MKVAASPFKFQIVPRASLAKSRRGVGADTLFKRSKANALVEFVGENYSKLASYDAIAVDLSDYKGKRRAKSSEMNALRYIKSVFDEAAKQNRWATDTRLLTTEAGKPELQIVKVGPNDIRRRARKAA